MCAANPLPGNARRENTPTQSAPGSGSQSAGKPRVFRSPQPSQSQTESIWDIDTLLATPNVYDASQTGFEARDGITPIFYDGLSVDGKPTRVFAWLGVPKAEPGEKLPGIVLVHGGGGSAFRDWVKMWMERGYVAIAMDTTGSVPLAMDGVSGASRKHEYAPATVPNLSGALAPTESQWIYHGVGAVVRANSLLRSLPYVDAERIGITGISWGGVLTENAVSVDHRFKFAAPVYGSGFLGENSHWLETDFQSLPPGVVERWLSLWDPSQHVFRSTVPMLFCNGTNDKHFRPDVWQKTHHLVSAPVTLSLKVRMRHSQQAGDVKEITVFANSILKGEPPLASVTDQGESEGVAWVEYSSEVPIKNIQLVYTNGDESWPQRQWFEMPAVMKGKRGSLSIPKDATAWYFNLVDERGCVVSSDLVILETKSGNG